MKKLELLESMKSSSRNKYGICSMQMIIILMSVILISNFIIGSAEITLKIISQREKTVQERLWGESLFQLIDMYIMEGLETTYNHPSRHTFVSSYPDSKIRTKVISHVLLEMWSTQVKRIGNALPTSIILEEMDMYYRGINSTAYVYDNTPGVSYYKVNKDMVTTDIGSSEDFAMTISVEASRGDDVFVFSKDYFFKIPLYSDELINEIKVYYQDASNTELWEGHQEFDPENTLITSEVYYEKK